MKRFKSQPRHRNPSSGRSEREDRASGSALVLHTDFSTSGYGQGRPVKGKGPSRP